MSTRPPLRLNPGGMSGVAWLFLTRRSSASRVCTIPWSWLMRRLASARCWLAFEERRWIVVMRPWAMARVVSVRLLSSQLTQGISGGNAPRLLW